MDLQKKGTGSLVCGIISVSLAFLCYFVLGFGEIAALILGIIAVINGAKSKAEVGNGKAGFILGIIGLVLSAIGLILWLYSLILLAALL